MSSEKISIDIREISEQLKPNLSVVDEKSTNIINIGGKKSVNFGGGVDLLMNPNRQNKSPASKPSSDINIDDINELENLNLNSNKSSLKEARSKMFDTTSTSNLVDSINKPNILNEKKQSESKPNVLPNASNSKAKISSSDGFKTFNEIPVNPTIDVPQPKLKPEEVLKI